MHDEIPDGRRQLLPDDVGDPVRGLQVLQGVVAAVLVVLVVAVVGGAGVGAGGRGHLGLAAGVQHVIDGKLEAGAEVAGSY